MAPKLVVACPRGKIRANALAETMVEFPTLEVIQKGILMATVSMQGQVLAVPLGSLT